MEEHVQKLMDFLIYVDYILKERVKIQSFFGGLPHIYRNKLSLLIHKLLKKPS